MSREVYVNGRYLPYGQAAVHVEDRGYQLADAVYEVIEIRNGKLVDATRHLARLKRSLGELEIPEPMGERALRHVIATTIKRNRIRHGSIYMQVSRGTARRDFVIPDPAHTPPSLVVIARRGQPAKMDALAEIGISVITMPDTRWQRCDIKTVMLLPACLAKHEARKRGAQEAWFLDRDGYVTEGGSSNAWIITRDNKLVTRALDHHILPGITRATTIDALKGLGLTFEQRSFTPDEAYGAKEAFVTSASNIVMPVVRIDDHAIGTGEPGPVARQLRSQFHQFAEIEGH